MTEESAARLFKSLDASLGVIDERFELIDEAGAGGMGTVYRAKDRTTGAFVAVKVMNGDGDLERFEREARALAELVHPSIVAYLGHGRTSEGEPWLAMEWLEGETLREKISSKALRIADAVELGTKVAEGLAAAHDKGIVHRDLKPSNIFLAAGEMTRAKILDFGVARLRDIDRELTHTGQVIGTPGYMAPEQARGIKQIDGRADLFSLGCVLFRCVAGRPPFQGDDILSLLAELVLHHPPRLGSIVRGVPRDLEILVARLLSKSAADRPASAGDVASELARIGGDLREGRAVIVGDARQPARERELILVVAQPAIGAAPPGAEEMTTVRDRIQTLGGTLQELAGGVIVATIGGDDSDASRRAHEVEAVFLTKFAGAHVAVSRAVERRDPSLGGAERRASRRSRRGLFAVGGALVVVAVVIASAQLIGGAAKDTPSPSASAAAPTVERAEAARRACKSWARALEDGRRDDGSYGIEKQRATLGWSTSEALAAQALAATACEGATTAEVRRTADALRQLRAREPFASPGDAAFEVLGFSYAMPFVSDAQELATTARRALLGYRDPSGAFPFVKGQLDLDSSLYGTILAIWALGTLERAAPDREAASAREDAERWLVGKLTAGAGGRVQGLGEQALWVLLTTHTLPGQHAATAPLFQALTQKLVDHCDLDRSSARPSCKTPVVTIGALALDGIETNFSTLWFPWALGASFEAAQNDAFEKSPELAADLDRISTYCVAQAEAGGSSAGALANYKISEQLMMLALATMKNRP